MATKAIPKKAVTKKVSAKKVTKKTVEMIRVPAELAFWTIDGRALHTLEELADALKRMEGRVYRYHADKDHQDFAAWVGVVMQHKAAAKLLRGAVTPKAAEKIIRDVLSGTKA